MNIFINKDGANWVIDSIRRDFAEHTKHKVTGKDTADCGWALNFWGAEEMYAQLKGKPFVATIHHVSAEKANEYTPMFNFLNHRAKAVIVPNIFTYDQIKDRIKIPIHRIPYWLLSCRESPVELQEISAEKRLLNENNAYTLIGSFQKDGNSGKATAKYAKNPQMFINVMKKLWENGVNAKAVLTGYSRKFVTDSLLNENIPFAIYPKTSDHMINLLYDCLDWYFVTSRNEGGPQAALECGYRKVRILSTPCGLAPAVLAPSSICETEDDFLNAVLNGVDTRERNYEIVSNNFTVKHMIPRYDKLLEDIFK